MKRKNRLLNLTQTPDQTPPDLVKVFPYFILYLLNPEPTPQFKGIVLSFSAPLESQNDILQMAIHLERNFGPGMIMNWKPLKAEFIHRSEFNRRSLSLTSTDTLTPPEECNEQL